MEAANFVESANLAMERIQAFHHALGWEEESLAVCYESMGMFVTPSYVAQKKKVILSRSYRESLETPRAAI